ncbi:MAG: hypothetical protein R3F14_31490 [Polyangiaceae bacterium]
MAHPSLRSQLLPTVLLALLGAACSSAPATPVEPKATAAPSASVAPIACEKGTGDCDGKAENACETRLDDSQQHCGACGTVCDVAERCISGGCVRATPLVARDRTTCLVQTLDAGAKENRLLCWGSRCRATVRSRKRRSPIETSASRGLRSGPQRHAEGVRAVTAAGKVACWAFDMLQERDAPSTAP